MTAVSTRPLSRGRWIVLVVGGVFAVALIAAATWSVVNLLGQTIDERRFTLTPTNGRIRIDTEGDIRIAVGTDTDVQVVERLRYGTKRPQVEETAGPDGLTLRGSCPWYNSNCSVDVAVTVPANLIVDAHSSAGDISVSGVTGQLTLNSSAGNVRATGIRSDQVRAESSAGDVELSFDEAPSDVYARSSAGDVTVRLPPEAGGYRVDASTSAGERDVDVPVDPASPRRISARSSAGDVDVRTNGL